jgi:hypothetical protein
MRFVASVSIFTLLCFFSLASANVILTCTDIGNNTGMLAYDFSNEASRVRAFALDVRVSDGVITSIGNLNFDYYVSPGLPHINPDGTISFPIAAVTGLGTDRIIAEMGSLYSPSDPFHNTPPPSTGILFTFTLSKECDVTIVPDPIRGGVVLEDRSIATVYAPVAHIVPEPATLMLFGLGAVRLRSRQAVIWFGSAHHRLRRKH